MDMVPRSRAAINGFSLTTSGSYLAWQPHWCQVIVDLRAAIAGRRAVDN